MKEEKKKTSKLILCFALILATVSLPACGYSSSAHQAKSSANSSSTSQSEKLKAKTQSTPKKSAERQWVDDSPSYEDDRWPTNNRELLSIPKSERWYNASKHIGTQCTIAGPIANSYQATNSTGSPIFLDIGAAYPNKKRVSIVIWDEDIQDNRQLLDDVYGRSNCWISVTGYLSKYNGNMQMKSSNGLSYTWWTGVN